MRNPLGLFAIVLVLVIVTVSGLAWYSLALPGRSYSASLEPLTREERDLTDLLREHVVAVASRPHNVMHHPELERSARYIEEKLESLGYSVERQIFTTRGRAVRNIEVKRPASSPGAPLLVVGAHYDSFGNSPGANDNGTGVAALLELARLLRNGQSQRLELRLVFFVNEEPPFYRTSEMGSWRYAKQLAERGVLVHGMICLETLGAFSRQPGTQLYPVPFGLIFPSTANFVAMVGMPGSRTFLHEVVGAFREQTAFPSIGGVAHDAVVPGIGWSDHWSFAEFGFPAMMITDTALFRYPHYHLPSDTPDKVSYEHLARITKGLERLVRSIASGQ